MDIWSQSRFCCRGNSSVRDHASIFLILETTGDGLAKIPFYFFINLKLPVYMCDIQGRVGIAMEVSRGIKKTNIQEAYNNYTGTIPEDRWI